MLQPLKCYFKPLSYPINTQKRSNWTRNDQETSYVLLSVFSPWGINEGLNGMPLKSVAKIR